MNYYLNNTGLIYGPDQAGPPNQLVKITEEQF